MVINFDVEECLTCRCLAGEHDAASWEASFLEGNAKLWFISLCDSDSRPESWEKFKDALSLAFSATNEQERARMTMFKTQRTGSLEDYILEFSHISLSVLQMDEHTHAALFVSGLGSPLKAEVLKQHPVTLAEAIRISRTAFDLQRFAQSIDSSTVIPTTSSEGTTQMTQACALRGRYWKNSRPRLRRRVRCYRCNQLGHIARNCKSAAPNEGRQ